MKYILKKDLPFAKAGTEIKLTRNTSLDFGKTNFKCIELQDECGFLDTFWLKEDLLGEWIEEVKEPREWIAGITNDGILTNYTSFSDPFAEIIKVREIID